MATAATVTFSTLSLVVVFLALCPTSSLASDECTSAKGECYDPPEALRLKILAIFVILATSLIGVCLPFFSRIVPALRPDRNLFVIVKAFASGVILATAYMHVLPDSFDDLTSSCLPENPWANFPFATFIAMLSSIFTLMLDSFMLYIYNKHKARRCSSTPSAEVANNPSSTEHVVLPVVSHGNQDSERPPKDFDVQATLLRNRIVAQVLEMGIIVHSVVIGLSMGASESPCTIRPLIAALCFHQLFEGMGLGGCILQAEYNLKVKAIMAFFFATTTPFGIALGIALTKVYDENGPTALIVVGVLNAVSAGLLTYMALVELLAADFLGTKLQESARLQFWAYVAVLLGAGGMSLMAKWA